MTVMSYNLRGTSGTGKTTVAREIMKMSNAKPDQWNKRKITRYEGWLGDTPIYFLGSYDATCGGCDTIPRVALVADALQSIFHLDKMTQGNSIVFFEGLMISHMLGTVGATQMELGAGNNILAFLNTPLSVCVERVMERRRLRGVEEDCLPDRTLENLIKDWNSVHRCRLRAIEAGYRVEVVPYQTAIEDTKGRLKALVEEVVSGSS